MQPALYILMRTDMASMNPGKGMAQAAHAANAFTHKFADDHEYVDDVERWLGEAYLDGAQGFGTTLTLAVESERELREVIGSAQEDGFPAGLVLDNTYPVRDGKVTHLIPVFTCGYVFTKCRHSHPVSSLAGLRLHP